MRPSFEIFHVRRLIYWSTYLHTVREIVHTQYSKWRRKSQWEERNWKLTVTWGHTGISGRLIHAYGWVRTLWEPRTVDHVRTNTFRRQLYWVKIYTTWAQCGYNIHRSPHQNKISQPTFLSATWMSSALEIVEDKSNCGQLSGLFTRTKRV